MIPACVELFAPDASFFSFLSFEHIEGESAEGGEVFRRITSAGSALVLPEANIQHPVQFVFHAPVAAHGPGECFHAQRQTRQIVSAFHGGLAFDLPDGLNHANGLESLPFSLFGKPVQSVALIITADFKASVVFLHRFQKGQTGRLRRQFGSGQARRLLLPKGLVQKGFHLLMHRFLIALESQHIIGIRLDDLPGDLLLAAHRIQGHDAAAQFQDTQAVPAPP